jgi:hypothetical protein
MKMLIFSYSILKDSKIDNKTSLDSFMLALLISFSPYGYHIKLSKKSFKKNK